MSKRHFEAIAAVIAGDLASHRHNDSAYYAIRNVALSMADLFRRENPRFDRVRFLRACGLRDEDAPTTFGGAL
jgi:hypothetical protein